MKVGSLSLTMTYGSPPDVKSNPFSLYKVQVKLSFRSLDKNTKAFVKANPIDVTLTISSNEN